uniref:Uncharacterized protein n=1 Tax=Panagrolaimus sp. PS1159 TaxID=55785 RepID=A0AC35G2P8_9BILA
MEPPEAKKSRIDSTSSATPSSKHQALKEKQEARKVLFLRYKNGEIDKVIEEIKAKKAFLRLKKTNVKLFFDESIEEFWQYETFFTMLATEMLAEPSKCNEKSFEALHEVIKLLTSGCVSSSISTKSTATEIFSNRNKNVSVPKLFTQILEVGDRMSTKTRVLLFDYISGLCTRKDSLIALSSFSAFVDQIAICISSPTKEIRTAALSTVILNSNKRFFLKPCLYPRTNQKWNHIFNNNHIRSQ